MRIRKGRAIARSARRRVFLAVGSSAMAVIGMLFAFPHTRDLITAAAAVVVAAAAVVALFCDPTP